MSDSSFKRKVDSEEEKEESFLSEEVKQEQ